MTNCMSYTDLDSIVGKKCKDLWEQVESIKDDMRSNVFLFLFMGLYNYSFQGHSS